MQKITMLNVSILIAVTLILIGGRDLVYAHGDEDGHASVEAVTYTTHIKPIFEKQCIKCHGHDSPEHVEFKRDKQRYKEVKKGPRMDSYARMLYFIGWPDTGAVMRRLEDGKNTKEGKPGNMYKHLGHTEEERQKNLGIFKEWIGNWTLKRWAAVTKEDLNLIKAAH